MCSSDLHDFRRDMVIIIAIPSQWCHDKAMGKCDISHPERLPQLGVSTHHSDLARFHDCEVGCKNFTTDGAEKMITIE